MPMMPVRFAANDAYRFLDAQPPFGRVMKFRMSKRSGAIEVLKGKAPIGLAQIWGPAADDHRTAVLSMMLDAQRKH